jgi:demethylmenaquinone methyltransferase/2-methoxy-6-polyprenyl-1,4-benzoquinol methylase
MLAGSDTDMADPRQVQSMFARIAGRYDLLNHTLSLGIDRAWRKAVIAAAGEVRGELVVDVCTGTGDLVLGFARAGARAIGIDFTLPMLERAAAKSRRAHEHGAFAQGDALRLPIRAGVARAATIAFGLRNVVDRGLALAEMRRILAPGGRALVLEFSRPTGRVFGPLYRQYFTRLLPRVGRLVSGDGEAYDYLPRTVLAWLEPDELRDAMERAGFVDCGWRALSRGIACLHWGAAPA